MISFQDARVLVAMLSRPASNSILVSTSMDPIFTPLNVKSSFTCEIERKEHFWKVLTNILNIIDFPRLSFSKCNFPSAGNLKIYSIQFQPILFSQKPELNTDILF
jgi:hypothetical protein